MAMALLITVTRLDWIWKILVTIFPEKVPQNLGDFLSKNCVDNCAKMWLLFITIQRALNAKSWKIAQIDLKEVVLKTTKKCFVTVGPKCKHDVDDTDNVTWRFRSLSLEKAEFLGKF